MTDGQQSQQRRDPARDPITLVVTVQAADLPPVRCQARNVSLGGMFVESHITPELSRLLQITLTLPSGRELSVEARVAHLVDSSEARLLGLPLGFGVKFEATGQQQLDSIRELVDEARQTADAEYAAYLERAAWLKTAETARESLSMRPPPPSSPVDAGAQRADLRQPSFPLDPSQLLGAIDSSEVSAQEPPTTRLRGVRSDLSRTQSPPPSAATSSASSVQSRPPLAIPSKPPPSAPAPTHKPTPTTGSRPPGAVAGAAQSSPPAALPNTARLRASRPPSARPAQAAREAPLGAAGQLLDQAEVAYAAGQLNEADRHLKLLAAMTLEDAQLETRVKELRQKVARAAAVDFEKQALHEEKHQRWDSAAKAWLRVAEGRPKDSVPLQRAALAQLQAQVPSKVVIETAKRAVDLAPADAQAHRTLAKVYTACDMQASARAELDAAERCSPSESIGSGSGSDTKPPGLWQRLLGRDDAD